MSKNKSPLRQQYRGLQIIIRDLEQQPYGTRTFAWHDAMDAFEALTGRHYDIDSPRQLSFVYLRRAADYRALGEADYARDNLRGARLFWRKFPLAA